MIWNRLAPGGRCGVRSHPRVIGLHAHSAGSPETLAAGDEEAFASERVFLCTVLGGRAKQTLLGPKEYDELAEAGYVELAGDDRRATLATQVGGSGWDVFQSRGELIRTFGEVFRIVDFVPGTQDLFVLQRPDAGRR